MKKMQANGLCKVITTYLTKIITFNKKGQNWKEPAAVATYLEGNERSFILCLGTSWLYSGS